MRKITFKTVEKWIRQSQKPLLNVKHLERLERIKKPSPEEVLEIKRLKPLERLEQFQEQYFRENKHSHYRFFYHLVKQMKPKMAVELGIDHGHTIVHMAAANPETTVIGIDIRMQCADPRHREYANCQVCYLPSQNTEDLISTFSEKYGKIGVVFQDSSHHYNKSKIEFDIYSKCLDKNAIWVCDDITPDFHDPNIDPPGLGMVEYFDELPGQKKIYDDLHYGTKVGVCLIP